MGHNKYSGLIRKAWLMIMVGMIVISEEKVDATVASSSSGVFCINDCSTCPVVCSPPPPILITPSSPSPRPPIFITPSPLSPPPITPSSLSSPPPKSPLKPYNTPLPTVISAPHDFSYPYYYFYASAASSTSSHAPILLFLFFLIAYSILDN
ncbi:hypothetical protein Fmac_000567 [Flemingia macrophylla]|uniref:Uncharacterized protein n=1 Tax=Flemingia macrophylla TaxID=520843 RepID=A0ABD1NEL6_9FABA